ncbi:MAG: hypothetical protein WC233_00345 [Sphaerochaeta sp.]|jgi:hypothetical protein|nr:hypothetical protein [Spirochaetales bacterium]
MMQAYLLSVLYLCYGAAFLLADEHGARFPSLLSLRYYFRTNRWVRAFVIIIGIILTALLSFFPMDPGPVLLGDLLPMINTLSLTVYFLHQSIKGAEEVGERKESVLHATGQYVDHNRRYVGYFTLVVAVLHFILPQLVIL